MLYEAVSPATVRPRDIESAAVVAWVSPSAQIGAALGETAGRMLAAPVEGSLPISLAIADAAPSPILPSPSPRTADVEESSIRSSFNKLKSDAARLQPDRPDPRFPTGFRARTVAS